MPVRQSLAQVRAAAAGKAWRRSARPRQRMGAHSFFGGAGICKPARSSAGEVYHDSWSLHLHFARAVLVVGVLLQLRAEGRHVFHHVVDARAQARAQAVDAAVDVLAQPLLDI